MSTKSVVDALVHEPVVHHELDPGRRQQVEDRRRLERVARHQLAADHPRDWESAGSACRETCARAARCARSGGRPLPSSGSAGRCSVPSIVRACAQRRIEIGRNRLPARAAAPPCRAGSSRAARCASRPAAAIGEQPRQLVPRPVLQQPANAIVQIVCHVSSRSECVLRLLAGVLHERRRMEDRHDLGDHRLARGIAGLLVAAERVLRRR